MRQPLSYPVEHGYHYPQQYYQYRYPYQWKYPRYPYYNPYQAQAGLSAGYSGNYPQMYQGNYPGSYLGNYPGNYPGNYSGSYPGNYPGGQQVQYYHCPTCGTPIQVIYVPAAQPNLNTLAILLIAVLILIAIDIVFLRGR